jgi:CHAT domain-containing protein/tetratricopeptide (TPR) repeat protein
MKRSSFYKYFAPMALFVVLAISGLFFTLTTGAHDSSDSFVWPSVPQTDASSSLSRGRALLKQGHADQALPLLQSALSAFTQANSARGIAAAEDALGDLYMIQGQYKVALDHYQKAHQAFATAAQKDQTNQAATSSVAGLGGSTAAAATQTAGTIAANNAFNANLMLAKIGDTSYRLGQMTEAGAAYNMMTVKKPEKKSSRFGLGNPVSTIMGGGKPTVAPTSVAGALSEITKEFEEYRAAIVYMTYELGLGRIAFAGNDLETARQHFQGALDAGKSGFAGAAKLGQTRRFRVAARTSLGDVALRQNRYSDAMSAFNDAVKGAKEDNRLDLMWSAQRGLGRSQWLQAAQEKDAKKAASLRESALLNYREGLVTIETLRAGSLRADESRTTFLATTKDVYDEASSVFAEMALMNSTAGAALSGKALDYAAESFRITEAGRARSLLDMLGEVNAQITEGVPAELLKRKQDNLDRQQQIAEQLTGIVVAGEQKQKPSELEGELDKLQTEFDQIENQIRTASPKYAALTAAQPLALAEVQQKVLDDGTVLVEYLLGKDSSYAFAVTQSGVSLFKLPRRTDVDKLATDFRAQLIPPKLQRRIVGIDVAADQQRGLGIVQGPSEDLPPFVAASNALYKAVVEPAGAVIADKRVLVVADGALNYIPFEALVKNTEGADYASLNYLVKTNQIVYSPSASVIAAIRGSGGGATGKNILLVADPVFSADDPRAKGSGAATSSGETRGLGLGLEAAVNDIAGAPPSGGLRLARLPGTRTEADEISKIAKGGGAQADLWTDLNANEDNVRSRDLSSYRYLHVATHGLLDAERPQFTGVVLSLVGNKANDGFLRTDEIFNLKLGTPLVMLSACETGLGKEKRGEGVIGLTRAFMYAGAPTVGVSLWSVADKSTADLMTDFYKRLLTGSSSPAASMRAAQVAMIGGKKYSAPFYWAPFVLVGEWK